MRPRIGNCESRYLKYRTGLEYTGQGYLELRRWNSIKLGTISMVIPFIFILIQIVAYLTLRTKPVACVTFFYFLEVGWDSPLGTSPTNLLYQPRSIDDECGAGGGMRIGRGNRSTRRKPAPLPLRPPHDLTCAGTRVASVGSRRLTAWAMARPPVWLSANHILFWLVIWLDYEVRLYFGPDSPRCWR
jgi:hypothetical protein